MNPVSGYEVKTGRATAPRVPIGRSYGSDDSPSLSDAPSTCRSSFQSEKRFVRANGKTMFEDHSPEEQETRPSVAASHLMDFAPSPSTDGLTDEAYKIGHGPYLFDVNGIPPAPSRLGRVEVERLIHAYRISGT